MLSIYFKDYSTDVGMYLCTVVLILSGKYSISYTLFTRSALVFLPQKLPVGLTMEMIMRLYIVCTLQACRPLYCKVHRIKQFPLSLQWVSSASPNNRQKSSGDTNTFIYSTTAVETRKCSANDSWKEWTAPPASLPLTTCRSRIQAYTAVFNATVLPSGQLNLPLLVGLSWFFFYSTCLSAYLIQ